MNVIVYDIEIINAIPDKNGGAHLAGITYCAGWHDHANMGISVVGVYDYRDERYRVFCEDNRRELLNLIGERRPLCVGFNNIPFDNTVMRATAGWDAPAEAECYDLLREIWAAAGLGPKFEYPSHLGFGLDAVCAVNFGMKKSGHGALAPVQWQRGEYGAVIDYCLNDVRLTKQLFDKVIATGVLTNPKDSQALTMRKPSAEELLGLSPSN
jgi:hypothetical protein